MDQLPDDVLTGVLARLAPRWLARARGVCREWRATVDARRLLQTDGLPLSVGGIFVNVRGDDWDAAPAGFFARPSSTGPKISARIQDYVDVLQGPTMYDPCVGDCCNGFLLVQNTVINPATCQWAPLPPCPHLPKGLLESPRYYYEKCLVFDPAVSPHYEVLFVPSVYVAKCIHVEGSQWPPSSCIVQVFSSRTAIWEQRLFERETEAAGSIAIGDVKPTSRYRSINPTYCHGAVYVPCKYDFVMRFAVSKGKYQVFELPAMDVDLSMSEHHLGKSAKGLYYAVVGTDFHELKVWFLNESGGITEWVLQHGVNLTNMVAYHFSSGPDDPIDKHWTLQDYYTSHGHNNNSSRVTEDDNFEWDTDDDNIMELKDCSGKFNSGVSFLYLDSIHSKKLSSCNYRII